MKTPRIENERAWAEIDLAALRHNFHAIRKALQPNTRVLAVLKANAYGHGALEVAKELIPEGLDAIGVANSREAVALVEAGVRIPVVVLGSLMDSEFIEAISRGVQFCVSSQSELEHAEACAAMLGKRAYLHIMVDTGMGRLGVSHTQATKLIDATNCCENVSLVGLATHFSSAADTDPAFSALQIARFTLVRLSSEAAGVSGLVTHAASHAALIRFPEAQLDMVRPGLALFGLQAEGLGEARLDLKRVFSLHAKVLHVKVVEAGTPVSYSRLWTAQERTRIATVAIGYNDGYRVGLTGKAEVIIGGKRCPVVGRVTMDYIMVDVGMDTPVERGSICTLIGSQGGAEVRAEELAKALGTVPYEIFCGVGSRVKRLALHAKSVEGGESLRLVA
ncbi:MAG: alanine racemase [Planctomycetes bacterium]|nr:alanine racemase [Planctomycetota bacterium]